MTTNLILIDPLDRKGISEITQNSQLHQITGKKVAYFRDNKCWVCAVWPLLLDPVPQQRLAIILVLTVRNSLNFFTLSDHTFHNHVAALSLPTKTKKQQLILTSLTFLLPAGPRGRRVIRRVEVPCHPAFLPRHPTASPDLLTRHPVSLQHHSSHM